MNKRTIDEMITYFNQEVSKMDISQENKIKLLGMITAIGFESKKPERKTGKWIKKGCDLLYCSECDLPSLHPWPYCERCGAKMEVERESD